jgi:hypothetical protein
MVRCNHRDDIRLDLDKEGGGEKKQSTNLAIGDRGKKENGGGEGAEESLGCSQQKVPDTRP